MKTLHLRAASVCISVLILTMAAPSAQRTTVSNRPDTPFKLATFEAGGRVRVGLVLDKRVLDINGANAALTRTAGLTPMTIPEEMRELIEAYERVKPRLYQIA